jgi:hypothetical protein
VKPETDRPNRETIPARRGTQSVPAVPMKSKIWKKEDKVGAPFVREVHERMSRDATYEWNGEPQVPTPDYP